MKTETDSGDHRYVEETTQEPSTCLDDSLTRFSNLSLDIPEESVDCGKKEEKEKHNIVKKSRPKSTLPISASEEAESIYNIKKSVTNPITGEIAYIGAERMLPRALTACKQDTKSEVALSVGRKEQKRDVIGDGDYKKMLETPKSMKLQSNMRRNPITGDGIELTNCPSTSSASIHSKIRISQPPGGMSSNIF